MSIASGADQYHSPRWGGVQDVFSGLCKWRLWAFMGLHDIRQRYRRSSFGPIWLMLGLGATILGIGLLYTQVLKVDARIYIPFLAISLLIWNYMSGVVLESTSLFLVQTGVITSVNLPYSTFALRCVARNVIVLAHCVVVVAIAFLAFARPVTPVALLAAPGLLLLTANLCWISLAVALLCLRYRDVGQIIIYVWQLGLFLTPIIWLPNAVGRASAFTGGNPLFHLIEIVRAPIFDSRAPTDSFAFAAVMLVVGSAVTLAVFNASRQRLVYWI